MIDNCVEIAQLKGAYALRMSQLPYRGGIISEQPNIEWFVRNHYKEYDIPELSKERISSIIEHNGMIYGNEEDRKVCLFPLLSLMSEEGKINLK